MSGEWVSQRVGAMGNAMARAVKEPLGLPRLDPLTTVVRESAQNSWDARATDAPVRFSIGLEQLDATRARSWSRLFGQTSHMRDVPIASRLSEPSPWLLTVSDRETFGLAGPTRADLWRPGMPRNYTSFVLNVGDTGDGAGGGTYGFGKSSFFSVADANFVIAYSRCRTDDGAELRLVGIALGQNERVDDTNYTGRHWWGHADGPNAVEPLRDAEALSIASTLGLPSFGDDEFGTTVAVPCPDLGTDEVGQPRAPAAAAHWLRDAILWHLWPKLVSSANRDVELQATLNFDGEGVTIPSPTTHRMLGPFVEAYDRVEGGAEGSEPIGSPAIGRMAGRYALRACITPRHDDSPVSKECGITGQLHHVCLLRAPNLVVSYLDGARPADPLSSYAGVFKTLDEETNRIFAAAEPPTHDEWRHSQLHGEHKTLVNATRLNLKARMKDFAHPVGGAGARGGRAPSFGAASGRFADLLLSGDRAEAVTRGGNGATRGPAPVRLIGDPSWRETATGFEYVQDVEVRPQDRVRVSPTLRVIVWGGGGAKELPEPSVVCWRHPSGEERAGPDVEFDAGDGGTWALVIAPIEETVTAVSLSTARAS